MPTSRRPVIERFRTDRAYRVAMPANSGDGPRRSMRREHPREWSGLDTAHGFERCVRATLRELYGYVALLCGRDRREAERHVVDVYRSLFQAVRAGHVEAVTLGALRSAGRRVWVDAHLDELVTIDEVSRAPASAIADLSPLERAVLVFRHVNGMTVERTAAELGRDEREIAVVGAHAVRRLRGTDDTSGTWLRAYLGSTVTPAGGLVDRIVRDLGKVAPPEDVGSSPEPAVDEVGQRPHGGRDGVPDGAPDDGARDTGVEPDDLSDGEPAELSASELATTELAVVERPTVELPAVVPEPPVPLEPVTGTPEEVLVEGDERAGRPRWVVAIGALLVAALIVALVWLVWRSDADDTVVSAPATSADVPPTSTPATAAETTADTGEGSAPSPTEVSAPGVGAAAGPRQRQGRVESGFDPVCVERSGEEPAVYAWSETFGPLGRSPAIVVTLPESVDIAADPERAPARPTVILRPDGAIVTVRAAEAHRNPQTIVARVGLDGTVAWVRCLDGEVTVGSRPDVGIELAVRGAGEEASWSALSVADGTTGAVVDPVQGAVLDSPPAPPSDGDDGLTLGFSYDSDLGRSVPAGLDDGRVVWAASGVLLPEADAFRALAVDGVVLAQSCVDEAGAVECTTGQLHAFDLATGEQLWSRPGEHQLATAGDGYALIGDGTVWEMVDVTTGTAAGETWDPDAFAPDEAAVVAQHGGALVVATAGSVSVWLPAGAVAGTASVIIP